MELVDENEGYYDEEVVDFLDGEVLPEFSLSTQAVPPLNTANIRARIYHDSNREVSDLPSLKQDDRDDKRAEIPENLNSRANLTLEERPAQDCSRETGVKDLLSQILNDPYEQDQTSTTDTDPFLPIQYTDEEPDFAPLSQKR